MWRRFLNEILKLKYSQSDHRGQRKSKKRVQMLRLIGCIYIQSPSLAMQNQGVSLFTLQDSR